MTDNFALHNAGHSLGIWLFNDTALWFEFVLHMVLMATPLALALILAAWGLRIARRLVQGYRERSAEGSRGFASGPFTTGIFRYVFKHTRRSQILLLLGALTAMPFLYAGLELPKLIINNAISSGHFPIEIAGLSLSQTDFLFTLSGLYLAVVLANGSIKYAISVHQGRVAESLLRRLRLTIYRSWRRKGGSTERAEVIPILVQEVEPIGGFAGDAFVLPLFQGGTFLTILTFVFVQDPVLGAAAITLLPVQLALIPRLQVKINGLARRRVQAMRDLGGLVGREIAAADLDDHGETGRSVAKILRRIEEIRFEIYRKKFFMKGANNLITHLTPFFFYTIGGFLVIQDRLSFGALVAVLAAYKDFSSPLKELFKYYQIMEDVRVRFAEIRRFLGVSVLGAADIRLSTPGRCAETSSSESPPPQAVRQRPLPAEAGWFSIISRGRKPQPCAPRTYS